MPRFRFHDQRHTVITELAELGVADHVLESISGHLSRRMLEHYSHIRIDAKRQGSTRWMRRGGAPSRTETATQTGPERRRATTRKHRTTAQKSRCLWHSPKGLRHSHVTVCVWQDRRPPVNC
ncbi:MAG: tyrosine-type recombinase/integrase [Acidobacteria bacterium]|nr:tyrosine-type recombinase/integrase [Acidobacteriota bacterium]